MEIFPVVKDKMFQLAMVAIKEIDEGTRIVAKL